MKNGKGTENVLAIRRPILHGWVEECRGSIKVMWKRLQTYEASQLIVGCEELTMLCCSVLWWWANVAFVDMFHLHEKLVTVKNVTNQDVLYNLQDLKNKFNSYQRLNCFYASYTFRQVFHEFFQNRCTIRLGKDRILNSQFHNNAFTNNTYDGILEK